MGRTENGDLKAIMFHRTHVPKQRNRTNRMFLSQVVSFLFFETK